MARYIDADKVLAEFPIRRNHYDEKNGNIHFINGVETVMEYIDTVADEQPADVQKVKHGRWIQRGYPKYVYGCSKCSRTIECWSEPENRFPYCHCGAKMDGKE